jgi:hypothetical protein
LKESLRAALAKSDDLVRVNFLNPDLVRWEKHRVWVVEATLKSGKRHVVPRRTYYVDEDSWQILMADGYDAQGKLGRQMYSLTLLAPDLPALTAQVMWGSYNLDTGAYFLNSSSNDLAVQYQKVAKPSASFHAGCHGQRKHALNLWRPCRRRAPRPLTIFQAR